MSAYTSSSSSPSSLGAVYSWGGDADPSLGRNATLFNLPQPLLGLPPCRAIAAGNHSVAVDALGGLWAWGRNESLSLRRETRDRRAATGQLGVRAHQTPAQQTLLPQSEDRPSRVLLPAEERTTLFESAAVGYAHSLAVAHDGRLLSWGANDFGQLGRRAVAEETGEACESGSGCLDAWPRQVRGLPSVHQAAASRLGSMAVSDAGEIWVWGVDLCGLSGPEGWPSTHREARKTPQDLASASPRRVSIQEDGEDIRFVQAAAGFVHWVALDEDGGVWTCATGDDGYNGLQAERSGRENAGWRVPNEAEELGRIERQLAPGRVLGLSASFVSAGHLSSAAVRTNGDVLVWGCASPHCWAARRSGTPAPLVVPELGPGSRGGRAARVALADWGGVVAGVDGRLWKFFGGGGTKGADAYKPHAVPLQAPRSGGQVLGLEGGEGHYLLLLSLHHPAQPVNTGGAATSFARDPKPTKDAIQVAIIQDEANPVVANATVQRP